LPPGLREYFSQTDECHITPRIPVMENMVDPSMPKDQRRQEIEAKIKAAHGGQKDNKSMSIIDEESDEDEDYQVPEANIEVTYPENNLFMMNLPRTSSTCFLFILNLYQNCCTGRLQQI
jgi:hypothetical protein